MTNLKVLVNAHLDATNTPQSIVIVDDLIVWCGDDADLPSEYALQTKCHDNCHGALITPGLIDCHTHLVYAGDRADEFQQRLKGKSYQDIIKAGGGILSTVRNTRAVSQEALYEQSLKRLRALQAEGVTTVEIKSGYGLDLATEIKLLQVARDLGHSGGIRVTTTFLGAHAIPPEFTHRSQDYIDYLCQEMLPAIAELKLADAVDVFCETIAFSLSQTEQLFAKAIELGLPIKCHAEQLSCMGASELAASMGALSCDHLEWINQKGVEAMANYGTIAVLLPGAFYFLKDTQKPPIALFRQLGVEMAIASDCNPGTSPTTSLLLMMNMACQLFGLTVNEALAGVTCHAAKALGLADKIGQIAPSMAADLIRWSVKDSASLCYHFGHPLEHSTMFAGQWL